MDKETEWMAMIAYARAVGAPTFHDACRIAESALPARNWQEFCVSVDAIGASDG